MKKYIYFYYFRSSAVHNIVIRPCFITLVVLLAVSMLLLCNIAQKL